MYIITFYKLIIWLIFLTIFSAVDAAEPKTHYPGVFVGSTKFDGNTDFTFGLEYEYRLSKKWGLGGAYERINQANKGDGATVWSAMVFYHPIEHWKLGLGAGQERIGGSYQKNKDLVRVALAYEHHLTDKLEIAPTMDVDYIDGEFAFVVGVALIFPF